MFLRMQVFAQIQSNLPKFITFAQNIVLGNAAASSAPTALAVVSKN